MRRGVPMLLALALVLPTGARRGSAGGIVVESPDDRCLALAGPFPPGLERVEARPGEVLLVNFSPGVVVPIDASSSPPSVAGGGPFSDLRSAIADAACNGGRDPLFDGITLASAELAFLTASSCESVAFIDARSGALRALDVGVPAGFAPGEFPFNPTPGTHQPRVAISTRACVIAPGPAFDSFGAPVPVGCDARGPSWFSSFTSGAALVGDSLFVSTSNLGSGAGTFDTQFLPGTVLVFEVDLDEGSLQPDPLTPYVFTSGFNPTHVTPYTTPSGRELVLVTVTGATGLVPDDPRTPEREAGGTARTAASIDVVDASQRRLVATIPLGLTAPSFDRLAIDAGGRVAMVGSSFERVVYAVDLTPLDALTPDAPFVTLDGLSGPDAVIFDADDPLELPGIVGGAPDETCAGFIVGMDFSWEGSLAYASDFCDGTLSVLHVDLRRTPPVPIPRDRFSVLETLELVAPLDPGSLGKPRALGTLRVRPGVPGVDFQGPDLAFLVGLPEGLVCTLRGPVPVPEAPPGALRIAMLASTLALAARGRRMALSQRGRGG